MTMKRIFLTFIFICMVLFANSQPQKWEHELNLSMGGWKGWSNIDEHQTDGLTVRAGYGLTYYFNEKTSITSGLDFVRNGGPLGCGYEYWNFYNNDDDSFSFLNVPFIFKYHIHPWKESKQDLILGIGPTVNFTLDADRYIFFEDDRYKEIPQYQQYKNALDGKKKIKKFNIGIQPTIMYQFNHVRVGIEANIGLLNMNRRYTIDTGKKIIYEIWPTFSYHF